MRAWKYWCEYILAVFVPVTLFSYISSSKNTCTEDVSALELELSDLRHEISHLRRNYSRIHAELRRTQEGHEQTRRQANDDGVSNMVEGELERLRNATRLLKEAINAYDDFVKNLDAPVKEAIEYGAVHYGFTCEAKDPADERAVRVIEEFRSTTMNNVTKIQEKIRRIFSKIENKSTKAPETS